MIEKVSPMHPDKIADRIAGAIVDLAYTMQENPRIAVEVLIGHDECNIICESSVNICEDEVKNIIEKVYGALPGFDDIDIHLKCVSQDENLAKNQYGKIRCGDNGIFKGVPLTEEQKKMSQIARDLYYTYGTDGKYILDDGKLIICQSHMCDCAKENVAHNIARCYGLQEDNIIINPLGEWTGGINVDTGATNRKLGSDMADAVTGGGLHGKDLSKADVAVNVYAFLKAQMTNRPVELSCAIGDEEVDGLPYEDIVTIAKTYVNWIGGFEKLAEWGLF